MLELKITEFVRKTGTKNNIKIDKWYEANLQGFGKLKSQENCVEYKDIRKSKNGKTRVIVNTYPATRFMDINLLLDIAKKSSNGQELNIIHKKNVR